MPKKGELSGYYINCENCGKEVYQTKTQYNRSKHHYCSNKCQKEFQHKLTHEDRKCEICGNMFHTSKKSTQRFCSTECQKKWQATRIGNLSPKRKRIKTYCDCCGADLEIKPSKAYINKYNFCNVECRQKWYSEIFSQSPEWKEKSRKRVTNLMTENVISTNTKPQQIINDLLNKMNISYINEKGYVYYSVDNYLNEKNLIIEVMGDFWHCNPLKYTPENMKEIQKKRIPKDKAKHTYILNNYNIEILYLWEYDIYNNIDVCKKLIEKYIENNGVLENYHSFNYSIDCNNLTLNEEIIIPFQDVKIA